jgi:hypothetical protein
MSVRMSFALVAVASSRILHATTAQRTSKQYHMYITIVSFVCVDIVQDIHQATPLHVNSQLVTIVVLPPTIQRSPKLQLNSLS